MRPEIYPKLLENPYKRKTGEIRLEKGRIMSRIELDRLASAYPGIIEGSALSLTEIISYMSALLGMLGDQLSTRLGLTVPGIYESNQFAAQMMERGMWLPFDILVLAIAVALPALLIHKTRVQGRWVTLSFPLLFGAARLFATVWNLRLFILLS